MKDKRCWLLLLLALTLMRGLIYAAVTPPWQAPDENGHFEYAWLIAHLGRLPTQEDISPIFEREMMGSFYEWDFDKLALGIPFPERMPARLSDPSGWYFARATRTVGGRFSLAYLWSALFLLPFRHQDLMVQLYAARLSSVLLNAVITWLALRTFLEVVPSRSALACLMTALVVFLPQHTFINSMMGDGPLAELMACLVLYCWARLFRRGFGGWEVAGIVLGTLIGAWTKVTVAFLAPLDAGLLLWWFVRRYRWTWTWRYIVYLCVGIAVLGIGGWLWSNSRSGALTLAVARRLSSLSELTWVDVRGVTFEEALLTVYDSFWARFGWMNVWVNKRWHGATLLLSLMALVGWVVGQSEKKESSWVVGMMGGTVCMVLVAFVWVSILSREMFHMTQGRYLFPILVPYAFLLVGGLERLFTARVWRYIAALFLLFLVCFDALCLAGYILPRYY